MNLINRVSWLDMAVRLQLSTIDNGLSRVVCCSDLVECTQDTASTPGN